MLKILVQVLQTIAGQNIPPNIQLVMRGLAKVFVGELVETGRCPEPALLNMFAALLK